MPDIKDRLSQDIATIEWHDLLPHAKRDAIVIASAALNLLEVGTAIAQDNTSSVSNWIENKSIYKPSSEQLSEWNNNPQKQFKALIVQPFVIIQEI